MNKHIFGIELRKQLNRRLPQNGEWVCETFHKDRTLRQSRFNFATWTKDGLNNKPVLMNKSFYRLQYFKDFFNSQDFKQEKTCSWNKLAEIYGGHKNAGQILIFTTEAKVKELEEARFFYTKNSIVIYPEPDETLKSQVHRNELCLGITL